LKKKKWVAPLLTVLTRGRPEEWVLATCKYSGVIPVSTTNINRTGCLVTKSGASCIGEQCTTLAAS